MWTFNRSVTPPSPISRSDSPKPSSAIISVSSASNFAKEHVPVYAKAIFGSFPTITQRKSVRVLRGNSENIMDDNVGNFSKGEVISDRPCCSEETIQICKPKMPALDDMDLMAGTSSTKVDFRSDDQPVEIMRLMRNFREKVDFCDVELEVEGDILRAHRYILAAASPYFRAMFTSGMVEMRKKRISMKDISKESMRSLIDYIYTNEIQISAHNVQQVLFAASILQMDNVVGACQQFLTKTITIQNCLGLHQFAELYNCTHLLSVTDDFAVDNFRILRKRTEFNNISASHLRSLLTRSDLNVNEESEVFETIIEWIEKDIENRHPYFDDLFDTLRLPLLGWSYLIQNVSTNDLVKTNQRCRDLVAEAIYEMIIPPSQTQSPTKAQQSYENISDYGASPSPPEPLAPSKVSALTLSRIRPRKSVAGIIFCAGGRGTLGEPFRSVEAYDWRRNVWFSISDMTIQRRHVGVVSAHGELYAIGGHDGVTHLATAEVFNPKEGTWRRMAPMMTARRGIAVAAIDSAIYAVGGLDDSTCFKTVERYDIELDEWSPVAGMMIQRGGVGVASMGKYLFAIGGNNGTSSLDSCEKFDPLLDRWRLIAPMQNRRAGAGVCVLDGQLYAIGGFDDNAPLATCERYDVAEDRWYPIANMQSARGGVGVAAMGGMVYAIGGHDGVRYLSTVECLDPVRNVWTTVADIRECRAGAGVAWADCRVDELIKTKNEYDSGCAPTAKSHCI